MQHGASGVRGGHAGCLAEAGHIAQVGPYHLVLHPRRRSGSRSIRVDIMPKNFWSGTYPGIRQREWSEYRLVYQIFASIISRETTLAPLGECLLSSLWSDARVSGDSESWCTGGAVEDHLYSFCHRCPCTKSCGRYLAERQKFSAQKLYAE